MKYAKATAVWLTIGGALTLIGAIYGAIWSDPVFYGKMAASGFTALVIGICGCCLTVSFENYLRG